MEHNHDTITFNGARGIQKEECSFCHRKIFLGECMDGCKMCQSCYHKEHGLAPLPSDSMYQDEKETD